MDNSRYSTDLCRLYSPTTVKESITIGVILTIMGLVMSFIIGVILGNKQSNRLLGMVLALFFTGVLVYLIFNVTGVSAQYKNDDLPNWLQ